MSKNIALPPIEAPNDPDLPASEPSEGLDRWLHAQVGKATAALSPAALMLAGLDWGAHLAMSPAKQSQLLHKAWRKNWRLALYLMRTLQGDATP